MMMEEQQQQQLSQQQEKTSAVAATRAELRALTKQRAKLGLVRVCACDWPECPRLQFDYTEAGDEDYGGPVVHFSTKVKHKNQQYRDGVTVYLGRVIRHDKFFHIAKHHFDRRQIQFMMAGSRLSTPLSEAELEKYTDTIDKRFTIYDERSKISKYFNLPTMTKEQVIQDLQTISASRGADTAEYEALTFETWRKYKRDVQQREKDFTEQVEALQAKLNVTNNLLDEARQKVENFNRIKRRQETIARQKEEAARQEEANTRAMELQREQASKKQRYSYDHQTWY